MGGLLITTVLVTLAVTLMLAVLVAVTVAPMFLSLQLAEARRFSTARWLAWSAGTVALGLGCAYFLAARTSAPTVVAVLPLALTWSGPAVLVLLEAGQTRYGGRAGQHE